MHSFSERHFLYSQHFHPFDPNYFKSNIIENFEDDTYEAITAYKQYFGEKKAIMKAMFDFFTVQVMIPGVLSIALTIYQKTVSIDNYAVVIYALLMIIWATYYTEMWKRK